MPEPHDPGSPDGAAVLGASVLSQIIEQSSDVVFLCDAARRWVYVNDAACRMLGRDAEDLIGRDYVDVVPAPDKAASRRAYQALLAGSTEMLTRRLIGAGGKEREVVFAPFPIDVGGRPHGGGFMRDFTDTRDAARTAAALAQSTAELVGTESTNEMLTGIARQAVDGTRAQWAVIAVEGEEGTFACRGGHGPGRGDARPWDALGTAPAADVMTTITDGGVVAGTVPGRPVVLPDPLAAWRRDPTTRAFAEALHQDGWRSVLCLPLAWDNRVIGVLMAGLADSTPAPSNTETELETVFCGALADQAAVAVINDRLSQQAARSAALRERSRVARELHDSVSQALFAMSMHARAAELAMSRSGLDLDTALGRSVSELTNLSRGTLAEMRALIFELRPEALAEVGLVAALRIQAAAVSARDGVDVTVTGPAARSTCGADVEAQLYRIVSEVMNGMAMKARAITVTVHSEDRAVSITIVDDGTGFDVASSGFGQVQHARIAQRVEAIGAELVVENGNVTVVSLRVATDPAPSTTSASS